MLIAESLFMFLESLKNKIIKSDPMKKLKRKKKIGLALGGGAVLGAAHIGVLKAIEEFEIEIACIAGTSIGAFAAAFYAFGKKSDEIERLTKKLDWLDISRLSLSQFGLLSNEKLGNIIKDALGDVKFEEAEIPLAMVAVDIGKGEKVILKEGKVAESVMSSTCIPGVFIPVEIDNRLLVDGGVMENVPITPLEEMNADQIIGVDLNAKHKFKKPENIIDVLVNTFDITLLNATKIQTEEADVLIAPDLSSFNLVDTDQIDDLIKIGYAEAKEVLGKVVK